MRKIVLIGLILLGALIGGAGWWWGNRPVPVALTFQEPFPSVSFAPFRRGQSPISGVYPSVQQIEEDLKSLVGVAGGIRTYTSLEGMDVVPALARQHGLQLTHSAWLGKKADVNAKEVDALIKAANQNPDVIKRVIVGNEVLLRQDLTPDQLIHYIRQVRSAIKQPVSYADVWAFYLRYPQVAEEVDYITIHILPYWEDEPIGVEDAAQHIVKIYQMIQQRFPGKKILIGEAGWPTRGRNRGPAAVNMENAAYFVRTLAKVAKENNFDYNVVEAFDQPWKAKLEGTVGAFWGVADTHRAVKFSMSGPVQDNPNWRFHAGLSVVLASLAAGWFLLSRSYGIGRALVVVAASQILAACVVWQGLNAWLIAYSTFQDVWAAIRIALHASFAGLLFAVIAKTLQDQASHHISRWGERLSVLYGLCAWAFTMLIFFNGRYRDIPNLEFLAPCLGLILWGAIRWLVLHKPLAQAFAIGRLFADDRPATFGPAKEMTIALWMAALMAPLSESLALYLGEDFQAMHPDLSQQVPMMLEIATANTEMLVWAAMILCISIPYFAEWRLSKKQP